MADVSLGEILSVAREPGEGSIAPRAKIDTSDLVHTLNQNAQFKAENDWRKFADFRNNLKDIYKNLGEIQGLDVAQADRPILQKKAADIFAKIGNDPKKFFSGNMADIEKEIGQLRSMSTQSVQDKVFDDAHRGYIERDPTLQTDENKSIIDGYFKQPLGQRKPYMLKLPSLYDPKAIAEQINAVIPQKFSQTGLSPDGKFINTTTGIRYDQKQFKTLADQMFMSPDPKTGRTIGNEVADRLKALPESVQKYYKDKYPDNPAKGFYDETVSPWRKPDQIEKTEAKDNPFELEAYKSKDKLTQMALKFGYDKVLEAMRIGGQKDLAKFREEIKKKSKKEQTGALNIIVDNKVNEAITSQQAPKDIPQGLLNDDIVYTMPISSATLKDFSKHKIVAGKSESISPDELLVSADGKRVYSVFRGTDGKFKSVEKFDIDEFKLRFGKDVLGVSATEKEINADDDGTDEESSISIQGTQSTKTKIPNF